MRRPSFFFARIPAMTTLQGHCADRFTAVRDAFQASFDAGEELGARFTVVQDGKVVIDLYGGHADRQHAQAFGPDTLAPIYSTTKALAALMIARLADQGKLAYGQTVASVWPAFGQAGKGAITIEQLLSHQAGLPGFVDPMDPADWFDAPLILDRLAAMPPLWPPGTASGYHPITVGYMVGEIFRRVDGRSLGQALREDVALPCGLDLWIGLPDEQHDRVAQMIKPAAPAKFTINEATKAAFLTKWASPAGRGSDEWRRMEIPSANGHATALSLARLMGALAAGGVLDGVRLLSPQGIEAARKQRIFGQDLVLPFEISWAAGFMRTEPNFFYGPNIGAFGHSGWGGACAFADPATGIGCAYVMNKQGAALIGDPRPVRLINAVYAAL